MELAAATLSVCPHRTILTSKQRSDACIPHLYSIGSTLSLQTRPTSQIICRRRNELHFLSLSAALSGDIGVDDAEVPEDDGEVPKDDTQVSSSKCKDYFLTSKILDNPRNLKISVEVSGSKTREIYDDVFNKMVAAAQPIPGFRRVKGGKTPNIPKEVLLQILGPSKVHKKVINKVINSLVAEYVEKENLKVSSDLSIEQSFEDLEAKFEPGENFSFDAVIQLEETN